MQTLRFIGMPALLSLLAGVACAAQPRETMVNTLGMKLVEIPAGEFLMGSDEAAADLRQVFGLNADPMIEGERPAHQVRITRPFYLGIYEVTVGEFRQFVEATGYRTDAETNGKGGSGWTGKGFGKVPGLHWSNWWKDQTDRHPVVNVSWNDSVAFCKWLSKQEGRTYRLPTEAEWEYACRAGTTTRFSSGNDAAGLEKVANNADPRRHPAGTVLTAPVGSLQPNARGLYDMHGNVFEWCSDWYKPDYYAQSPAEDPPGPERSASRIVRGGCWGFNPAYFRSTHRGRIEPSNCGYRDGFRVVCEK